MKKRFILITVILISVPIISRAQSVLQPNYGLKSHETLEIKKIETTSEATSFYMSIENRIQGGSFCADRNIFIIYPDETKSKLISSSGIPVCPDIYKFRAPGEKLDFVLVFPPVRAGTGWIDLVEECGENCFSFYGITLDDRLNKLLDDVFYRASNGKPSDNIVLFKSVLDSIASQDLGIEGLLYVNIIDAAMKENDNVNAIVWYKRLTSSNAPGLSRYLKYLNDKGIKY
jgi:hypothetical protein